MCGADAGCLAINYQSLQMNKSPISPGEHLRWLQVNKALLDVRLLPVLWSDFPKVLPTPTPFTLNPKL
jgi:hypothetical protein